jgi:hypothetical protein
MQLRLVLRSSQMIQFIFLRRAVRVVIEPIGGEAICLLLSTRLPAVARGC